MAEPRIHIERLRKAFRRSDDEVVALNGIDLDVQEGEFVCLLGPSGCGKSTLLNLVAGFDQPTDGTITAMGKRVTGPGPERAMVFQEYALFPWMTVEKNISFGLEIKGTDARSASELVSSWMTKLSIGDFRDRFPKELSAGMRQRVAIARALPTHSPRPLMDEPFG